VLGALTEWCWPAIPNKRTHCLRLGAWVVAVLVMSEVVVVVPSRRIDMGSPRGTTRLCCLRQET